MVTIQHIQHGSEIFDAMVTLRLSILREPLGLKFTQDELDAENSDILLGAFEYDRLIGCLILTPQSDTTMKMRQVAVHPDFQGQGIGRLLVEKSEEIALASGVHRLELHARVPVVPFYLRLGYQLRGEQFEEVTIPHQAMFKIMP